MSHELISLCVSLNAYVTREKGYSSEKCQYGLSPWVALSEHKVTFHLTCSDDFQAGMPSGSRVQQEPIIVIPMDEVSFHLNECPSLNWIEAVSGLAYSQARRFHNREQRELVVLLKGAEQLGSGLCQMHSAAAVAAYEDFMKGLTELKSNLLTDQS